MLKKFHDGAANEAYIFAAISRPLLKSDDIEVLKWYRMEKVLQKILSFVMLNHSFCHDCHCYKANVRSILSSFPFCEAVP